MDVLLVCSSRVIKLVEKDSFNTRSDQSVVFIDKTRLQDDSAREVQRLDQNAAFIEKVHLEIRRNQDVQLKTQKSG